MLQPYLFALIPVGVVDFTLAYLFSSGRIGPLAAQRRGGGGSAEAAELDPSLNPYARED